MLHGEHMHRPSSWLFFFAIFSLCLAVPCPSAADERILSYDVSATLEKDSSLRVVERITVNVERKRIKRDFPRSFPIKEILSGNKMRHHGFEVFFAKCDGRDVPYTRQDKGCATDILIGNENRLLSFGIHIYELAYRTTGHVRFLNSHDELAFSVIGLDNQFPVDSASFTLRLPPEAVVQGTWAYTGKPGDENADCEKIGPAAFKTTRILNRHEGMTVVAAWQKGVVTLPLETQLNWMGRNRQKILGIITGGLVLYLLLAWPICYARPKPKIAPLDAVPETVTPGLALSLRERGYGAQAFLADALWAAIQGYLKFDLRDTSNIVLYPKEPENPPKNWKDKSCRRFCSDLFQGKKILSLQPGKNPERARRLADAYFQLKTMHAAKLAPLLRSSFLPGLIGLICGLLALYTVLSIVAHPGLSWNFSNLETIAIPWLLFMAMAALCIAGFTLLKLSRKSSSIFCCILGGFLLILTAGLGWFQAYLLRMDWEFIAAMALLSLLPLLFIIRFFTQLTPKGKALEHSLQGLECTIRKRIEDAPAADTVLEYEELLPYAIALGHGDAWQKRFAPLLKETGYTPSWLETEGAALRTIEAVFINAHKQLSFPTEINAIVSAVNQASGSLTPFPPVC